MGQQAKTFLVSTADFALYYNDILACVGTTNLNTSIEVSMEEQNVNAGKGNKLIYSFKYGRELNVTLEAADWKLEYIAANTGSEIVEGLTDVYAINECVQLTGGIGTVAKAPIGDVAVELANGAIVTVKPEGSAIDLKAFGLDAEAVRCTYRFNRTAKTVTIDADTAPKVFKLVLDADKHNNKVGKIGTVQVIVPSYQLSGNFNMEFTPDGVSSFNMDGKALAVEGDTCADGSAVYAYVKEFDDEIALLEVSDIVATPANVYLNTENNTEATISVVGMKGALYAPIELENDECEFVSDTPAVATVSGGVITAVGAGNCVVTVKYKGFEDTVAVQVL